MAHRDLWNLAPLSDMSKQLHKALRPGLRFLDRLPHQLSAFRGLINSDLQRFPLIYRAPDGCFNLIDALLNHKRYSQLYRVFTVLMQALGESELPGS